MRRNAPYISKKQSAQLANRTSLTSDLPAPIGGLNTRDSLSTMSSIDAISLINWIPGADGLTSRKGYAPSTSNYSGLPETLIPYINGSTNLFITASGGNLYTDNAIGTLTSIGSGYSNARWRAVKLGANMVLVNGADAPQNYNGSVISTPSLTGDIATYGASNINGITKHRNRIYMWDTNYGNFFYGGTNSVSGGFTEFQLNRVSDTSGNIVEVKSISRDGGSGPDDYLAFMLSTGEVLIYGGSDPGDANNWSLVGKYKAPPIISIDCAIEFGGDVLMLCRNDLIKLSDVIKYGTQEGGLNIQPSKLSGAITRDFQTYGTNYGWSVTVAPTAGWIIVNVPIAYGSESRQYVVNTVTGAATEFNGWPATKFSSLGKSLYFGAGTELMLANEADDDDGSDIQLVARQAYSNLGSSQRKKMHNARLYIQSEGDINVDMAIGIDYGSPNFQGTQASQTTGSLWDVVLWDVAFWSGTVTRLISFIVGGIGVFISPQISIKVSGQTIKWFQTTFNYDVSQTY